jgi:hypothetical protein
MIPQLPLLALIGLGLILVVVIFIARKFLFVIHSIVLLAALLAIIGGLFGGILGGISAYVSIYGVNNYLERVIGPKEPFVAALGGAVIGIVALVVFIFGLIIVGILLAALVGTIGGTTTSIPIVDSLGSPLAIIQIWAPGPTGGMEDGAFGCGAFLLPGFLVAPIIGAIAGVNLVNGTALDITDVPWTVATICMLIVGLVGLISGIPVGILAGRTRFGGVLTGVFYGYLVARFYDGQFGFYILANVGLAMAGYFLAGDKES